MTCHKKTFWIMLLFLLLVPNLLIHEPLLGATSAERGPDLIVRTVVGAAGSPSAGVGITANGTMGQSTPIGIASGNGIILHAGFWAGTDQVTGVETPDPVLLVTALKGNYPNPFNPRTKIEFSLAEEGPVELEIFNIRGELVRTLLNENRAAGPHAVLWDGTQNSGRRTAAGLYFYRLRANEYESVKKMLLLK